ncbi:MAG: methyltransferase domain-containing protein [Candidatus Omnitrophota bacterium]
MDIKKIIKKNIFVKYPYRLKLHNITMRLLRRKTAILMYHGFAREKVKTGIENHQGKHLDIARFDDQMRYLKNHYNPISLPDFIRSFRDKRPIPDNSVIVTLDDGYESNYLLAYPILKRYGIPAALFVTTGFVENKDFLWVDRIEYAISRTGADALKIEILGRARSFDLMGRESRIRCEARLRSLLKRLPRDKRGPIIDEIERQLKVRLSHDNAPPIYRPLQWGQIREMADSGLVTIGSHTHSHIAPALCGEKEALEELSLSKEIIEDKTERICDIFCYPNGGAGDFNARTKRYLKSAGYLCGLVNIPGFSSASSDVYKLRRFGLSEDPDIEEFIMTLSGIARLPGTIRGAAFKISKRMGPGRESSVLYKFDQGAANYAAKYEGGGVSSHSFTVRRERVIELLKGLEGGKALDVGCGPGVMVDYLTGKGFDFYGIDISENMIAQCRERFGRVESARFSVGKVESLEFPDSFFDVVTCMGVTEYIDDDRSALREMARVLKPGGHAIITLPNKMSPYRLWHRLVCNKRLVDLAKRFLGRTDPTLIHREYTEEAYKGLLSDFGLEVEEVAYYNFNLLLFPLDKLLGRYAAYAASRLEFLSKGGLRRLGTGFIVKARKTEKQVSVCGYR